MRFFFLSNYMVNLSVSRARLLPLDCRLPFLARALVLFFPPPAVHTAVAWTGIGFFRVYHTLGVLNSFIYLEAGAAATWFLQIRVDLTEHPSARMLACCTGRRPAHGGGEGEPFGKNKQKINTSYDTQINKQINKQRAKAPSTKSYSSIYTASSTTETLL